MDLTAGLSSLLHVDSEIGARYKHLLKLRSRRRTLMIHACAHSVFFYKLLLCARQQLQMDPLIASSLPQGSLSKSIPVGIIGGGQLGKQLVKCLIGLKEIEPQHVCVSTRRPETLREIHNLGVRCLYDNKWLVRWAQVVYLCVLPSQLPAVCAEISGHLREPCVVYSLVSTVPLPRLKALLSHSSVVRPEYRSEGGVEGLQWEKRCTITEALRDEYFVKATTPGELQCGGGVYTVSSLMDAALYAFLNVCTSQALPQRQALRALNGLIQRLVPPGDQHQWAPLTADCFVSSQAEDSPFPRFDLCCVQMEGSPLRRHIEGSPQLREQLVKLYRGLFCHPT
ncbi:NADP-dependent oxidoreductase domain-containing protein 1 [Pseudophryne corroboree]|uniref:NADP-dependent oxidoreductase domain-containing protein 1 n=1 Tax=Pseudophryne corroboree TaxID=495146 RepID=UPI003081C812